MPTPFHQLQCESSGAREFTHLEPHAAQPFVRGSSLARRNPPLVGPASQARTRCKRLLLLVKLDDGVVLHHECDAHAATQILRLENRAVSILDIGIQVVHLVSHMRLLG